MLDLRVFVIAFAIVGTAVASADRAATQETPKGRPPGSLQVDCQKRALPTLSTQSDIRDWLKKNHDQTTACIATLKTKLDGVNAGKMTWDQANKVVDGIIKQAQDMLEDIEGKNGLRDKLDELITQTKQTMKSVKTIIKNNPQAAEARIAAQIKQMEQALGTLDQQAKGLSAKVFDLGGKKPEWALEWYLADQDEIIKAILTVADGVSQHAAMLSKIEIDASKQKPSTGN